MSRKKNKKSALDRYYDDNVATILKGQRDLLPPAVYLCDLQTDPYVNKADFQQACEDFNIQHIEDFDSGLGSRIVTFYPQPAEPSGWVLEIVLDEHHRHSVVLEASQTCRFNFSEEDKNHGWPIKGQSISVELKMIAQVMPQLILTGAGQASVTCYFSQTEGEVELSLYHQQQGVSTAFLTLRAHNMSMPLAIETRYEHSAQTIIFMDRSSNQQGVIAMDWFNQFLQGRGNVAIRVVEMQMNNSGVAPDKISVLQGYFGERYHYRDTQSIVITTDELSPGYQQLSQYVYVNCKDARDEYDVITDNYIKQSHFIKVEALALGIADKPFAKTVDHNNTIRRITTGYFQSNMALPVLVGNLLFLPLETKEG